MTVHELKQLLESHPAAALQFVLPSGEQVPAHFHVTEVGRVEKRFVDCGGVRRDAVSCAIQLWYSFDLMHRLPAGKLARILDLAAPVLGGEDLPIEIEYGNEVAAHYFVAGVEAQPEVLRFALVGRQTDCLARDQCGVGECSTTGCCG